ncbi:hypothetical protein DRQ26_04045, partial [bacterium]
KRHNPSAYLMEWVTEWDIIYRSVEEFRGIFLEAGFKEKEVDSVTQKMGIMQYCLVNAGGGDVLCDF